jgi:hypothetical protein
MGKRTINGVKILMTDEDIDRALEAAAALPARPSAISGEYNRSLDLVLLKIDNGDRLVIPREQLQGLENATEAQLSDIQIFSGQDIAWPQLDVDHYLPYLLEGKYASEKWKKAREQQRVAA